MKKRMCAILILAAIAMSFAPSADAHKYDPAGDDMWLRYVAYAVHPFGVALEYTIGRPMHWLVSQPDLDKWFGHEVTEDFTYEYFEWD
jgi:hypothetical protein